MTLEKQMHSAAQLRNRLAYLTPIVEQFKQTELDLKAIKMDILTQLDEKGIRSTDFIAGHRVTKVPRTNFVVQDEDALTEWIANNIEDPSPYIKQTLDLVALKGLAKQVEDKTGKLPTGGVFEKKYSLRFEDEPINDLGE